jgi:ribosomal protein L11 methyltransferase
MAHRKAQDVWRISLTIPAAAVEAFEAAFEPYTDAFLCFEIDDGPQAGLWKVDAYNDGEPDLPRLRAAVALAAAATGRAEPALDIVHEPPRNWLAENLQTFHPIGAGRFFVHGSHFEGRPPWGREPLMVDAGTAFGSGEHQSTYGCLLALDDLARRDHPLKVGHGRALDMGCGSGILALAMARHWKIPVVATDIDAESVRVTRVNARLNGLARYIEAFPGDGFTTRRVGAAGPYDVICANILARPLCAMAKDLAAALAPGGRVILAGLLARQEAMVVAAYRAQGLRLVRRYSLAPWVTLVLR